MEFDYWRGGGAIEVVFIYFSTVLYFLELYLLVCQMWRVGGGGEHHGQRNSTKFGNPGVGLGLCINVILVLFVNEVVPRSPSTGVLSWIQMKQESIDCSRQPIPKNVQDYCCQQ